MDLILPAAGSATRMRGIPKFLLPINEKGESLLERHISQSIENFEKIWIPTTPKFEPLLHSIFGENIEVVPMNTKTMTETVLRIVENTPATEFALVMPDTYFMGESPIKYLHSSEADLNVACWNIKDSQKGKLGQVKIEDGKIIQIIDKEPSCDFRHSWGAISFNRKFINSLNPEMPHVGYAIPKFLSSIEYQHSTRIMQGEYFDCGTPQEYFELIYKLRNR
jgi:choline kinase